jgi:hypothetical protein
LIRRLVEARCVDITLREPFQLGIGNRGIGEFVAPGAGKISGAAASPLAAGVCSPPIDRSLASPLEFQPVVFQIGADTRNSDGCGMACHQPAASLSSKKYRAGASLCRNSRLDFPVRPRRAAAAMHVHLPGTGDDGRGGRSSLVSAIDDLGYNALGALLITGPKASRVRQIARRNVGDGDR